MTKEEAIKILDPETSRNALLKYKEGEQRLEACNEACRIAASAIRAQKTPLDRRQWEGCDECRNNILKRKMVRVGRRYCHYCGRPLTEEAWVELERRINGGTTD